MKRLALRWLTHRSRVPRRVRAGVAVVLGALWLSALATPAPGHPNPASAMPGGPTPGVTNAPTKSPDAPVRGDLTTSFPDSPQLRAEGFSLYEEHCSSCHGVALQGVAGTAPSLRGVGAGPVDFYLSTGRMPLANPHDEPLRAPAMFGRPGIDALIAYITKFGGPPAPAADPSQGNLSQGRHIFTLDCAGCHQMVGRGGMFVGAFVPDLTHATAQEVAEAVRMGPYLMPHFDDAQIDQRQLDSLVRYVLWTQHPANAGGWSIDNLGPIPEGLVAWFLGLGALLLVARLIGERLDEHAGEGSPAQDRGAR